MTSPYPHTFQTEPDVSAIRQKLLNECKEYIHNRLPTYLLDIRRIRGRHGIGVGGLKLVSRDHLASGILSRAEADLEQMPQFGREAWRNSLMKRYQEEHRYAILSHKWNDSEFTYKMLTGEESGAPEEGIKKLLGFCRIAASGYQCPYAWADTCCINKDSSAELGEAVRSFYRWYRDSDICIVYLGKSLSLGDLDRDPWFKRGWTLQELLAPKRMKLYGSGWAPINTNRSIRNDKEDETILGKIEVVTGIPRSDIRSFEPSRDRISEKMRWMAPRETTRTEDIAYSLIGLFDISVNIRYGDGDRAFCDLMEVIVGKSFDPSFLAWCGSPSPHSHALPESPSCYKVEADRDRLLQFCFRRFSDSPEVRGGHRSYKMKKNGLQVKVLIVPVDNEFTHSVTDTYVLPAYSQVAFPVDVRSTHLAPARFRAANPSRHFVLGVVDYHSEQGSDGNQGSMKAGNYYFCLLLKMPEDNPYTYIKGRTENVVVLKCEGDLHRCKVESVVLAHVTH